LRFESFDRDKFHVVTMISNPVRYQSRYRLYQKFAKHVLESTPNFWTIEVQLGDRPFCITDANNPRHIQVRDFSEIWIKESALNIAISKLPSDWETVAWLDADIEFNRKDWVEETLHQLQVYQVVQMFETAIDLGPSGRTISVHKSFMSQYLNNSSLHPETAYQEWHPGFCWAARREAIDGMGKLFDRAILGASDRHMALAFIGKAQLSFHPETNSAYQQAIMDFQERCWPTIRRDVGVVPGTIIHSWHGKKRDRKYWDRWLILVENDYRPYTDVKYDSYGLLTLHDDMSMRFVRLRDQIRHYFRQRNEDSSDET
jgi:hypothetical protein